jgi:hypothetical protein
VKSLLLIDIDRGEVDDQLCGGCRFVKPTLRPSLKNTKRGPAAMWCVCFNVWCEGYYEHPMRLAECRQAEAEARV